MAPAYAPFGNTRDRRPSGRSRGCATSCIRPRRVSASRANGSLCARWPRRPVPGLSWDPTVASASVLRIRANRRAVLAAALVVAVASGVSACGEDPQEPQVEREVLGAADAADISDIVQSVSLTEKAGTLAFSSTSTLSNAESSKPLLLQRGRVDLRAKRSEVELRPGQGQAAEVL